MDDSTALKTLRIFLLGFLASVIVGKRPQEALLVTPQQQVSDGFNTSLLPMISDIPLDQAPLARTVAGFEPEGISLAPWQETVDGWTIKVSWQTGEPVWDLTSRNPQLYDPSAVASTVQFGLSPSQFNETATGQSLVYTTTYSNNSWSDSYTYHSPILHHALLKGLQPGELYYYRVGNYADGWSETLSFCAPGAVGEYPLRIGVIGDLGQTLNSTATLALLEESSPDIVLLTGDLSYADRYCSNGVFMDYRGVFCWGDTDQRRWDAFARHISPLFSRVPLLTTPGNHDAEALQALQNQTFLAYNARALGKRARFPNPTDPSLINTSPNYANAFINGSNIRQFVNAAMTQPNNSFYSVDVQGAHILSISNYVPYSPDSAQYKWLMSDLATVDREQTPWLIVMFHEAPYHTYNYHFKEVEEFRLIYEPVFYEAGVDVVFLGHCHAYERTLPMYNYSVDPCGPMYVIIGNAGNVEGMPGGGEDIFMDKNPAAYCNDTTQFQADLQLAAALSRQPLFTPTTMAGHPTLTFQDGKFCPDKQPDWSANRELSFGHGLLNILNATHATWEHFRNEDQGAFASDSITILKTPDNCRDLL